MATKKSTKKAASAEEKKAAPVSKKTKMTPEEKAAKKKARMEAIKNRPAGQRPNSKQVDIIDLGNGSKVLNFGAPVRKVGTLVTSVALDGEGNVVSTAVTLIPGVTVKSKKGHGTFKPGAPGMGKGSKAEEAEEDSDDEEGDSEDEEEENDSEEDEEED